MSVWSDSFDDDIIDDDRYGVSDSVLQDLANEIAEPPKAKKEPMQPLHRDVAGMKLLAKHGTSKEYFSKLEKYIVKIANASMARALPKVAQQILDGYVMYCQKEFGYNDYHGGLVHAYYATVIAGGRRLKSIWRVSNKVEVSGRWGKRQIRQIRKRKSGQVTIRRGAYIYKIRRRRHSVRVEHANTHWAVVQHHEKNTKEFPVYSPNGNRLRYNDFDLNWRGVRLRGKKDSRGRRRFRRKIGKTGTGNFNIHDFYYGHGRNKDGSQKHPHGSMHDYYKKERVSRPYVTEDVKNAYRYHHKRIDPYARGGFKQNLKLGNRKRPGIEIFNAAPYANAVARKGYAVLPGLKVRQAWGKQIAKLMKKDFDKFLK